MLCIVPPHKKEVETPLFLWPHRIPHQNGFVSGDDDDDDGGGGGDDDDDDDDET